MRTAAALALLLCIPLSPLTAQAMGTASTEAAAGAVPAGVQGEAGGATGATGAVTAASTTAAQSARFKPDLSVPRDTKEKWVVAFTALSAEALPPPSMYLAYSIPLLLKDAVSGLQSHILAPVEIDRVRDSLIARERDSADQAITRDRKRHDELFFGDSEAAASAREGIDASISASSARKSFLETLDPALIEVAAEKRVVFKEGTGTGKLFDPPQVPAGVFCARENVDLAIGGTISEVQGYILLDLWAFDATRQETVFSYREAGQREETYASLLSAGKELVGIVLGREWSSLSFAPDPAQSALSIDGKLVVTGRTPEVFLAPGTREARISAPGYHDTARTLELAPGEHSTLSVTLERERGGAIDIYSDPLGAELYVGSVWKGKTPLTIDIPPARSRAVLSLSGFFDQPFALGDDSPPQLSFTLEPSTFSRDERQRKARDAFYAAFAWFALSLPIPLFSWAFAVDNATKVTQLLNQGSFSQANTARITGNVFYGVYLGGTVASVSIFAWMVVEIVRYVTTADRTAG